VLSTTIDASLVERISRGEYRVDPEEVAQAMISRWAATSFMLIAAQAAGEPAVGSDERQPGAGPDLA
jgi:Anti-sigma-28 factor, FlgM